MLIHSYTSEKVSLDENLRRVSHGIYLQIYQVYRYCPLDRNNKYVQTHITGSLAKRPTLKLFVDTARVARPVDVVIYNIEE